MDDVREDANLVCVRFILAIKNKRPGKEIFNARCVLQGPLDKDNELLFHTSTTVSQQAIRLFVSITTIFVFLILSENMTLAYIQGAQRILRKAYVRESKSFNTTATNYWKYHTSYMDWLTRGNTVIQHFSTIKKDLSTATTAWDLSLFFTPIQWSIQALIATHLEDTIFKGIKKFQIDTIQTKRKFGDKPRE